MGLPAEQLDHANDAHRLCDGLDPGVGLQHHEDVRL